MFSFIQITVDNLPHMALKTLLKKSVPSCHPVYKKLEIILLQNPVTEAHDGILNIHYSSIYTDVNQITQIDDFSDMSNLKTNKSAAWQKRAEYLITYKSSQNNKTFKVIPSLAWNFRPKML